MRKIAPLISTKFDFSPARWDARYEAASALFSNPLRPSASISFKFSLRLYLSISAALFPPPLPSSASLPVRLSGILPRLFEEEQ